MSSNYKSSGVDVEAGDKLVDWLQLTDKKGPHQSQVVEGIGGFASLFRIPQNNFKKPCLVTCTDGVGTKVKLASQFGRMAGIGQDLVAMCVNDLICTGGDPLMFLDYYAVGKLDLETAKSFLESVRRACLESQCALVGGETAEMPGVYHEKDFDCAGFAVGLVDEEEKWGAHRVFAGDQIIALESSGFHSNGYSLLRKVFAHDADKYIDELLEPTRLYVKPVQFLKTKINIKACAHITGGGIENIPRVLKSEQSAKIKVWPFSKMYQIVQERTQMSTIEMLKTLNCGVGLMLVVDPKESKKALEILEKDLKIKSWVCGTVIDQKTEHGYLVEGL